MIRIWCLFDVHLPWASLSSSLVRGPIPNVTSAASHLHCEFHHICQYFAHRAIKKYEEYTVHTLHTRCHNVSYTYVHSFAAHLTVNEGSRVSAVAPWLLAFYIEVEPAQSSFSDEKDMSNCQTFQCGWQLMQCNGIPCVVTVCLACFSQGSRSNVPSSSGEDIEMERKRHPVRIT